MFVKAVNTCHFVFGSVPYLYNTQEMCDKVVDHFLAAFKFLPDWFVRNKIIKKVDNALFADVDILLFDENSGNVKFSSDEMGILFV